jgi:hypothetical protein
MSSELHSTSKHACIIEEFFSVILLSILPFFQCYWSNCLAFKPWPLRTYMLWEEPDTRPHQLGYARWKIMHHFFHYSLVYLLFFPPASCDDSLSLESVTGEEEGDQKRWTQAHTISGIEVLVPQQRNFFRLYWSQFIQSKDWLTATENTAPCTPLPIRSHHPTIERAVTIASTMTQNEKNGEDNYVNAASWTKHDSGITWHTHPDSTLMWQNHLNHMAHMYLPLSFRHLVVAYECPITW